MEYAFAAMMGWCGTKWPGWRPGKPDPDPEPWWSLVDGVIGAIGGIVAWVVFGPMLGDGGLLTTGLVTFMGGVFLSSLASGVGLGAKRAGITTPG
jgi:hypothetical protein